MTPSILSHQFDNGLVLVAEVNRALESVAFTFLVKAGCGREPENRLGLASLACEMTLRGAGKNDSRQFLQELENLGVERHESVSNTHAGYGGATLAANLTPALTLYADLLQRPHLPSEQLDAARLVVLQELYAIEDDPSHKLMIELRRRHYPEPFGRSSEGSLEGLNAITMDDVGNFLGRHFHPNGTILAVAGRFEWETLVAHVGQLFADWPSAEVPAVSDGASHDKVAHVPHESNQTQVGIAYDSVPYRHPDYFQASAAVGVLSGGMSSRLFTEVREKRGLCYSVFATLHTLRDRGSLLCYAGTSADRAQETLDVTLQELHRLHKGILADELDRLKARIKSGLIMQQESSSSRSGAIARDWYHLGHARTLDEVGRLIDELTCESINAYLKSHPAENFTIVTLGPSPLEVPVGVSSTHA